MNNGGSDSGDAGFDDFASAAGAALRQPAPDGGLAGVRSSRQRRRVTHVAAATGAVAIVFVAGALLLRANRDDSQLLVASESSVSTSTDPLASTNVPATSGAAVSSGGGSSEVLAEGRFGGPLRDEGCDWTLVPLADPRGVSLRTVTLGGSGATNFFAGGFDDVVWVSGTTICADAPTLVVGGVGDDVTRVVVRAPDGEELELELFDVPGQPWRAVMGEFPSTWRTYVGQSGEIIAFGADEVVAREPYALLGGSSVTPPPVVSASGPPIDLDPEPIIIEQPQLPATLDERWTTTIEGTNPVSPVRIDDVIVFGQSDLPGVRAVDARSGELLWSVDLGDDTNAIASIVIVDGRAVVNSIGFEGEVATVIDTDGNVAWTRSNARGVPGAVVRLALTESGNRVERLGADGSAVRSVDLSFSSLVELGEPAFEVRDDNGSTWYKFPSLDRIAGPLAIGLSDDDFNAGSTATNEFVASLDNSMLTFFDTDGEVATIDLDVIGQLAPIVGEEPTVLVAAIEQPDSGRIKPGDAVTAYRLVDDAIVELWTRPGRLADATDREGRTYAIVNHTTDDPGDERSEVIDAATGETLISNGSYLGPQSARDGFVLSVSDESANRQTVAYDLQGNELWRIVRDRQETTQIIDGAVLVANIDSVTNTVDLILYD